MSRQAVHDEMETARVAFHRLVAGAAEADLRRASEGTRWTNELSGRRRMVTTFDHVIASLHRQLAVADIYHYPTQHFRFHQHQLTLDGVS